MMSEHKLATSAPVRERSLAGAFNRRRAVLVVMLALLLPALLAGTVSAQSPQAGTPAQPPAVSPEHSPRAEGPAQASPDADLGEDEDDESEGCPYLGTPLELVV